jgi:hypothetical protein
MDTIECDSIFDFNANYDTEYTAFSEIDIEDYDDIISMIRDERGVAI